MQVDVAVGELLLERLHDGDAVQARSRARKPGSLRAVAGRLGRGARLGLTALARMLGLALLRRAVGPLLDDPWLTPTHARAALALPEAERSGFLRDVIAQRLDARAAEVAARGRSGRASRRRRAPRTPDTQRSQDSSAREGASGMGGRPGDEVPGRVVPLACAERDLGSATAAWRPERRSGATEAERFEAFALVLRVSGLAETLRKLLERARVETLSTGALRGGSARAVTAHRLGRSVPSEGTASPARGRETQFPPRSEPDGHRDGRARHPPP
jgi:hypothetical protein